MFIANVYADDVYIFILLFLQANDVEIYVDGNCFKFYVKPYFLRYNYVSNV